MKKTLIATTLLLSSGLIFATEQSHEHNAPHSKSTIDHDNSAVMDKKMPMMHESLQKMRSQMAEIHQSQDPDKRENLLMSHMNNMQDMMKMMGRGMNMSEGNMGEMPQDGMMEGKQQNMMEMMNRQGMMEKRMNMMQMMMDQMIQNQAASKETCNIRDKLNDHMKMK
jgi:hypothetical protein